MTTEAEILQEVEQRGRLTPEQEDILYNIALKQDELGREPVNMLLERVQGNPLYEPMLEREFLTYDIFNHGGRHEVACLYVTLKGLRYSIMFSDEISGRRPLNAAGAPRESAMLGRGA